MATEPRPWGPVNPNSQHQLWSRWTFVVYSGGKHPPCADVKTNFARWARTGFGSVARAKVEEWHQRPPVDGTIPVHRLSRGYLCSVECEGRVAHDRDYQVSVKRGFLRDFVEKGFGCGAVGTMQVKVLAGDQQDGRPRGQLLIVPSLTI